MGHNGGTVLKGVTAIGWLPIWIDNLKCTGEEKELHDCPFAGWGRHNCSHSEDVGLSCTQCEDAQGGECLRWQQTGHCRWDGPDQNNYMDCKRTIMPTWSGICKCGGGKIVKANCGHAQFTCEDECAKLGQTFASHARLVDDNGSVVSGGLPDCFGTGKVSGLVEI